MFDGAVARKFNAVIMKMPVSSVPLKQAISRMVVVQKKLQKQRVMTPSTQVPNESLKTFIGQTQRPANTGPTKKR